MARAASAPDRGRRPGFDNGGDRRGNLLAEVIGHGLDEELGMRCIFVYPLAAQHREVLDGSIGNLAAPSSLHLRRRKAAEVDPSNAARRSSHHQRPA